ncbi:MAG: hypothetical protein ACI83W_000396 [Marinoscillum sp.]|jgi:hypothetical protein
MKSKTLFIFICLLSAIVSCESSIDQFDTEKDPLKGKIGGEDWEYASGNARFNVITNYLSGIMVAKGVQEPCAIRLSGDAHLTFQVTAERGTFNLGNFNGPEIIFNTAAGAQRFTASGGFIQIAAIDSRQALGYINATFDDDNYVQGAFLVDICQ